MRFVVSVWVLILSSLLLFTFVVVTHQFFARDLEPVAVRITLLVATWGIGLTSAGAIHLLYRRTERAIQQTARDETVVQLAAAVAHELNQPLTVIISTAELMAHRERSPEEIKAAAQRMADASHRMADIVGKLQTATCYRSKPYVGTVQIVDLDRAS